jgi:two-component system, OmpR family, KDP operon response regulator KdpE
MAARILIVDDEPSILATMAPLLRSRGSRWRPRRAVRGRWTPSVGSRAAAMDQPEHLRVLVNALRRRIAHDPATPTYILTEPWVGYRFAEE